MPDSERLTVYETSKGLLEMLPNTIIVYKIGFATESINETERGVSYRRIGAICDSIRLATAFSSTV